MDSTVFSPVWSAIQISIQNRPTFLSDAKSKHLAQSCPNVTLLPLVLRVYNLCLERIIVSALINVRSVFERPGSEPTVSEGIRHGDPVEATVHQ